MKTSAPTTAPEAALSTTEAAPVVTARVVRLHGLKSCDSVKQAVALLAARNTPVQFHDFKREGLSPALLASWVRQLGPQGWKVLLNRQGTTWRKLSPEQQAQADDEGAAFALLLAQPSLVKRPVVAWPDGRLTVGLPALQAALTAQTATAQQAIP